MVNWGPGVRVTVTVISAGYRWQNSCIVTHCVNRLFSIALAAALLGGCVSAPDFVSAADGGESNRVQVAIQWPIEHGVSSFVTQSAARSNEPFPCGSGVNSQHILEGETGDNHDYEHSLDIVARILNPASSPIAHDGRGTDIVAVADGTVVAVSAFQSECDRNLGAGNYVIIEHPDLRVDGVPVLSAYMHLNSTATVEQSLDCDLNPSPIPEGDFTAPVVGTQVAAGQKIGELGNTGNSTGTHLHFQFASECTLEPATSVECTALPVLEIAPQGFSDLSIARDDKCQAPIAVGGPIAVAPSAENYLSDGSYVTSRFYAPAAAAVPRRIARR